MGLIAARVAMLAGATFVMCIFLLALYSVEIAFSIKYVSPKESMVAYMWDSVRWESASEPPRKVFYNRTLGFVPFYMVSLEGSKRRTEMAEFMDQSAFKMEFFPAVYGSRVTWNSTFELNKTGTHYAMFDDGKVAAKYDAKMCNDKYKRFLTFGEIGCALSHYELYRKCVRENIPMMFIIEDDVWFTKTDEDIQNVLSHLPDPSTFDLAYFQVRGITQYPRIKEMTGTDGYFYRTRASDGTYGYLFTLRFARRILENYVLYAPADELLKQWASKNRAVVLGTRHRFVALKNAPSEKWMVDGVADHIADAID
eukprot:TRINITY_DN6897_c0_g1_i1.p1 TRINITY_DN6897_c0_g1~~TRINITY_DN6897_c0_g1_i1.p1  ORF type:complete len:311 (+),score=88.63 TRINITY_DN6897_c0_g1_i1:198-1130(+)